jgi:hypothetical protein
MTVIWFLVMILAPPSATVMTGNPFPTYEACMELASEINSNPRYPGYALCATDGKEVQTEDKSTQEELEPGEGSAYQVEDPEPEVNPVPAGIPPSDGPRWSI